MLLVRGLAGSLALASGSLVLGAWGVGELVACALSTVNLAHVLKGHGAIDARPVGLLIPALFMVGSMFQVNAEVPPAWLEASMVVVVALKVLCRLWLGVSFSAGPSTWVGLVASGPYRIVRHPLMALALVSRVILFASMPNGINAIAAVADLGAILLAIAIEEAFLRDQPAWAAYAGRVRWRLCPGVW
jgi:protein-S-isoprenylcysteine O-methyltransferase Ste14